MASLASYASSPFLPSVGKPLNHKLTFTVDGGGATDGEVGCSGVLCDLCTELPALDLAEAGLAE